jgi:hypothetical protein
MERTAVLVLRAWLEDATGTGLRLRITQTLDVSRHGETVIVAGPPATRFTTPCGIGSRRSRGADPSDPGTRRHRATNDVWLTAQ